MTGISNRCSGRFLPPRILGAVWLGCWLGAAVVAGAQPAVEGLDVVFVVNDAAVKDQMLEGVLLAVRTEGSEEVVVEGTTDSAGRLGLRLLPADYRVSLHLPGYVALDATVTIHSVDQVVTTSLSRMLEASGDLGDLGPHRIRVVLNWGSEQRQVRDADSHLRCACDTDAPHVYFGAKEHQGTGHRAELDVDDTEWGGPETITVSDPIPGRYLYWVHDYSYGPGELSSSDVVVRVLYDDTVLAERRMPPGSQSRAWRPFAAIEIASLGEPARVVAFTETEIEAGLDFEAPPGFEADSGSGAGPSGCSLVFLVVPFSVLAILIFIKSRQQRGRRRRP